MLRGLPGTPKRKKNEAGDGRVSPLSRLAYPGTFLDGAVNQHGSSLAGFPCKHVRSYGCGALYERGIKVCRSQNNVENISANCPMFLNGPVTDSGGLRTAAAQQNRCTSGHSMLISINIKIRNTVQARVWSSHRPPPLTDVP